MIKEIMTSEGRFIKSLVGKKVNINDDYLYKQPEESYSSDNKLYIPNEFVNAQFEIAGEINDWYLIKNKNSYRNWYYWAKKSNVTIVRGGS